MTPEPPVSATHAPARHARMIRLLDLEPACPMASARDADAFRRRYSVLFADEATSRRGGLGVVTCVTNAYGELLALKTLLPPAGEGSPASGSTVVDSRRADALALAFRREYESQRSLAGLACVPRLYGFGMADGSPAILMEWVEGQTLARVHDELAVDGVGRVSPPVVAALGRDLFDMLAALAAAPEPVVHRDVSPANVMVRTSRRSLSDQVADGMFDLCLVDFGSSVAPAGRAGSLTRAGVACRWATPDYAPPEMLTDDVPGIIELRSSPAIDVYAAAGVLYELACGRLPFGEKGVPLADGPSPYLVKAQGAPAPAAMAHADPHCLGVVLSREPGVSRVVAAARAQVRQPSDEACCHALSRVDAELAGLLAACLAPDQAARPTAEEARDWLAVFCARYGENVARALRGEPPELRGLGEGCRLAPAWRGLRVLSYAVGLLLALAVSVTCCLATGSPAALVLALPAAAALCARGRSRATAAGLLRGTLGVLLGGAAAALVLAAALPSVPIAPALLAACSAGWLPVAVDYATLSAPAGASSERGGA